MISISNRISLRLSFLAAATLIASSAHADQALVNFGASAYTSDGSNTWQTFDLEDGGGQFAAVVPTELSDTTGSASGITMEITGGIVQNGPSGPWNGVGDNAGASQAQFDAPASGAKPSWFDSTSAEQRETFKVYDWDITYIFSGFTASDTVQFDFAVGAGGMGAGDRALTVSYPAGPTTLMDDVQVDDTGRYTTISLTGSTSYSFLTQTTGLTSAAPFNALAVTTNPDPDTTDPTLTGTNPADDAGNVLTTAILVATFSESIMAGTGNIELRKTTGGDALVESFDVTTAPSAQLTFSGATVTIDPTNPLDPGVDYYVLIPATAVKDDADNFFDGISDNMAWNFTTFKSTPIAVTNHSAQNGVSDPWVATTAQAGVHDAGVSDADGWGFWVSGGALTQTLTDTYTAGTTYIMTVDVIDRPGLNTGWDFGLYYDDGGTLQPVVTTTGGPQDNGSFLEVSTDPVSVDGADPWAGKNIVLVLNRRDASGSSDWYDNVRLEVANLSTDFAITDIVYSPDTDQVTLTWLSRAGVSYSAFSSPDLIDWSNELGDSLEANDEIDDDGDHITVTFTLTNGLEELSDLFFRIEER
jgi:hypothetical protein